MAQSDEHFPQNAGKCTDELFFQAQELAQGEKKEAFDLYLKSAQQGNPASAYMVSQYCMRGLVEADELETLMWLNYSAIGYYPYAKRLLDVYAGCRKMPEKGMIAEHCMKKAEEGDPVAMFMAGMAHLVGMGTYFDAEKAYGYFCRSADAGNLDGLCQKALCMIRGAGTAQDKDAGLSLLRDTAEKGSVRAALKYAWCLEHGIFLQKDRRRALNIYESLAVNKIPIGMYETGRCYMDGIGTDKDENMGYAWFTMAKAFGSFEADFGLARCMLGGIIEDKREEGLKLLKQVAEKNSVDAMIMLAQLYNKGGKIVKKDEKAAFEYFKKAADLGRASSEFYISECYSSGEGVKKDVQTGVKYALRAAAHGNVEGCYLAGTALLSGSGIKKDEKRGFEFCRIASDEGYMRATYAVASCYSRGKGVEKDFKKAFEMHKELVEHGFIKSMLFVGEAYYHGDLVTKNLDEAFKLFKEGAEKDNVFCQYYLAECYDKGNGTKEDKNAALKWYKKAADQGHVISAKIMEERKSQAILEDDSPFETFEKSARSGNAQSMYILGRYYEDGIGIEKDLSKAKEWYQKAKKRGNPAAKRALEALEKKQ